MFRTALAFSIAFGSFSCNEAQQAAAMPGPATNDGALPYYNSPDFTPVFIHSASELDSKVPHRISSFAFTDQAGQLVTEKNIDGKIHVADFFFTSCGSICPRMTGHMKTVSNAFVHDSGIVFLSYSVTPWIDSVGRLREYAATNGISSANWHLLTGSQSKIYELARKSYFAEQQTGYSKDSTEFLHTEHFLLVDKNRRIRGIYNGTLDTEMQQLIADIKQLKQEDYQQ